MRAIILAAGEGTRLRPYTYEKPKCLVSINGSPLISRQLLILKSFGYAVTVVAGWQSSQLQTLDVDIIENIDFATTNMVSTLYRAQEILDGARLISYGDIAYSPSILKMLENNNADISTVVDLNWREYWSARSDNPIEDLETMRIESTDLITELGARPLSLDEIQGQYIGLTYMSPRGSVVLKNTLLECNRTGLVNGKPFDTAYFTDLLQELINRGHEVAAVKIKLPWIEVDTVEDLVSESTISRLEQIDIEIRKILES